MCGGTGGAREGRVTGSEAVMRWALTSASCTGVRYRRVTRERVAAVWAASPTGRTTGRTVHMRHGRACRRSSQVGVTHTCKPLLPGPGHACHALPQACHPHPFTLPPQSQPHPPLLRFPPSLPPTCTCARTAAPPPPPPRPRPPVPVPSPPPPHLERRHDARGTQRGPRPAHVELHQLDHGAGAGLQYR